MPAEAERVHVWVDGGARGNPGPAGWGVLLAAADGRPIGRLWGFLGRATNNIAEYRAVIAALEEALARGARRVVLHTDSELVERQLTGAYKVRKPHLAELYRKARALIDRFDEVSVLHVPRAENAEADRLANRAMDERRSGREP